MKNKLVIIGVLVLIVSAFVSCSANSSSENLSTTAVTDGKGITHYYEPVTDDKGNVSTTGKNQGVFAEIETQSDGRAVTKKDGTYVTNEHTTVLPIENVTDNTKSTKKPESEKSSSTTIHTDNTTDADNVVEFEPERDKSTTTSATIKPNTTESTEKETTKTTTNHIENETSSTTKVVTDKDGWIDKWY